jgi:hypothetical protein
METVMLGDGRAETESIDSDSSVDIRNGKEIVPMLFTLSTGP